MVGLSDLFWAYQNSGPALLTILTIGGWYIWTQELKPRMDDLEQTQEDRGDRWQEHELTAQERDILLEDAHERIDQTHDAIGNLRRRLRNLEQQYAAEHSQFDSDSAAPGGGDIDLDDGPNIRGDGGDGQQADAEPRPDGSGRPSGGN